MGELRQGALEGSVVEGVAAAAGVPAARVRRALMLEGDLGTVAAAAIAEGEAGLDRFRLTVLRPVYPMLAQTAADTADALERIHPADVEWKLDGVRLQVHIVEGEVRAFARTLADVTDRVPEVVETMSALPCGLRSWTGRRSHSDRTAGPIRSRSPAAGSRAGPTWNASATRPRCRRSSSTSCI